MQDAVLQALSRHENPDAGLKESVAVRGCSPTAA